MRGLVMALLLAAVPWPWTADLGGAGQCLVSSGPAAAPSWAACGGGSGAPTDGEYVTFSANATLSAERVLTNGTRSTVNTATSGQVKIDVDVSGLQASGSYSGVGVCGANTWASTLAAGNAPTCSQPAFASLSGTATDAQLASSYSGVGACGANQWASTLNDNAAPSCTQPAFTNLSGAASISQGGTTETASTEDAVLVGSSTTDWVPKVLPSCSNATTSKLLYDSTTNTFSCGADQTGAAGGLTCVSFLPWSPCNESSVTSCTVSGIGCVATVNMTALGQKGSTFLVDMDRFTHAKVRYTGALAAAQTGVVTVNLRNYTDSTNDIATSFSSGTTCADRTSATTDLTAKTGMKVFGLQIGDATITDDPLLSGVSVEFCTGTF